MATAKKKTVKKATKKVVKPAKKTTKAKTTRRKKLVMEDNVSVPPQDQVRAEEPQAAAATEAGENVDVSNLRYEIHNEIVQKRIETQRASEKQLTALRVLSLENHEHNSMTRILLAIELGLLGYGVMTNLNPETGMNVEKLDCVNGVNYISKADMLVLDHEHKLVQAVNNNRRDELAEKYGIGYLIAGGADIQMVYSEPTDGLPEVIEKADATYVRIA